MNWFTDLLERRRKREIRRRLQATMRPDPEYREKRLAQFSSERRRRYERNVQGL